ncbi:MAG: hypothetical protein R2747_23405 [Pyrinomonadaceae bacterium]
MAGRKVRHFVFWRLEEKSSRSCFKILMAKICLAAEQARMGAKKLALIKSHLCLLTPVRGPKRFSSRFSGATPTLIKLSSFLS